jgi:hypothetical protein
MCLFQNVFQCHNSDVVDDDQHENEKETINHPVSEHMKKSEQAHFVDHFIHVIGHNNGHDEIDDKNGSQYGP